MSSPSSFTTPNHGAQGDQLQDPPPPSHRSTSDASESEPSMLEWLFGRVKVTATGPAFDIRDGNCYINGVAIWKAMTASPSVPNGQDPSVVNFLNALGVPSDLESRRAMAAELGLDPSTIGTAHGNTILLNLLRSRSN